ncbi:MAG: TolC family protein [Thermoanaerobaculales bacterium]|nr:TolC family protein [Thermoanaerobaculales bacterium]
MSRPLPFLLIASLAFPCLHAPAADLEVLADDGRGGPSVQKDLRNEEGLRLTLDDAIRIAFEQNRDIQLAREALIQAETDIHEARSAMLPSLGAEATYVRLDEELTFELGPQALTFMDREIYKAGFVVQQPIFVGGRLKAAHRAAHDLRNAQAENRRHVEQEIVFQVKRVYRMAQVAAIFQKVATEGVDLLEAHEHDVEILVREGAISKLDLPRTRTELANAHKQFNAAENALELALAGLKNLLAIDQGATVLLIEPLNRPIRPPGTLSVLTELALSQRPELLSLKAQKAAAEEGLKAAKGEYLPGIALEGRYEYIEGDVRDLEGDFHWTVGVGAEVPLWNWGRTAARVKKARSQLEQTRVQLHRTEDLCRLEVRQASLDIDEAEKNIAAAAAGLDAAEEAYRLARVIYRAGEGTNTEVLDSRTGLSRAQANHAQAIFEFNLALAALERAVGDPLISHSDPKLEEPVE